MTVGPTGLAEIIQALSAMDEDTRGRTIAAIHAYFGSPSNRLPLVDRKSDDNSVDTSDPNGLPSRASTWLRQNDLAMNEIEKVFHITGDGVEIIAGSIPGKSRKEQTFNAYRLLGVSQLLATGTPDFDDKSARELCVSQGCYDSANHAANFRDKSNDFAGSKDKGWTLTAPGLKVAALLVKEMASGS
jgi:hypothetical protein